MEYWLFSSERSVEEVNSLLNCQLYSAIHGDEDNHFTKPRRIIDIQADHAFEALEALSQLDKEQRWIINPTYPNDSPKKDMINFEVVKHLIKNKKDIPHIEIAPLAVVGFSGANGESPKKHFNNHIQDALTAISYGVDYILLHQPAFGLDLSTIKWIAQFRDKGLYKTRIAVWDYMHYEFIQSREPICYDVVAWATEDIIHGDTDPDT